MKGNILMLSGRVTRFGKNLQIVHPDVVVLESEDELEGLQGIIPFYSEINGIKQGVLRKTVRQALDDFGKNLRSIAPSDLEDSFGIPHFEEAMKRLHYPDETLLDEAKRESYVKRLIFEEYLLFQVSLQIKKKSVKEEQGIRFITKGPLYQEFERELPFQLTDAHLRVIREIENDMGRASPMNRLLQGDVTVLL